MAEEFEALGSIKLEVDDDEIRRIANRVSTETTRGATGGRGGGVASAAAGARIGTAGRGSVSGAGGGGVLSGIGAGAIGSRLSSVVTAGRQAAATGGVRAGASAAAGAARAAGASALAGLGAAAVPVVAIGAASLIGFGIQAKSAIDGSALAQQVGRLAGVSGGFASIQATQQTGQFRRQIQAASVTQGSAGLLASEREDFLDALAPLGNLGANLGNVFQSVILSSINTVLENPPVSLLISAVENINRIIENVNVFGSGSNTTPGQQFFQGIGINQFAMPNPAPRAPGSPAPLFTPTQ